MKKNCANFLNNNYLSTKIQLSEKLSCDIGGSTDNTTTSQQHVSTSTHQNSIFTNAATVSKQLEQKTHCCQSSNILLFLFYSFIGDQTIPEIATMMTF